MQYLEEIAQLNYRRRWEGTQVRHGQSTVVNGKEIRLNDEQVGGVLNGQEARSWYVDGKRLLEAGNTSSCGSLQLEHTNSTGNLQMLGQLLENGTLGLGMMSTLSRLPEERTSLSALRFIHKLLVLKILNFLIEVKSGT